MYLTFHKDDFYALNFEKNMGPDMLLMVYPYFLSVPHALLVGYLMIEFWKVPESSCFERGVQWLSW